MRALLLVRFPVGDWHVLAEFADEETARYVAKGDAATEALAEEIAVALLDDARQDPRFAAAVFAWRAGDVSAFERDAATARTLVEAERIMSEEALRVRYERSEWRPGWMDAAEGG